MTIYELNVSPEIFGFSTGLSQNVAVQRSIATAKFMQQTCIASTLERTELQYSGEEPEQRIAYDPSLDFIYPIVINIFGAARSGKDTFVKCLEALNRTAADSSVIIHHDIMKIPKALAENIRDLQSEAYTNGEMNDRIQTYYRNIDHAIDDKTDPYRQLLHDIKTAWKKFSNGPVVSTYLTIWKLIQQMMEHRNSGSLIFINNRDYDSVIAVQEACHKSGLICLNLLVDGRSASSGEWTNDCDSKIDTSMADLTVHNNGTLQDLNQSAHTFLYLIKEAQLRYGVRSSKE